MRNSSCALRQSKRLSFLCPAGLVTYQRPTFLEVDRNEGYSVQLEGSTDNGTLTYRLVAVSAGQLSFVTLNETGYLTIALGVTEDFFIDVSFGANICTAASFNNTGCAIAT